MRMIDACKSFEERTVFLARVIAHYKAELHRMELRDFARMLESAGNHRFPFSLDNDEDILSDFDFFDGEEDEPDDPGKPVF